MFAVLKLALRLELGLEYDTNANRAEVVKGVVSPDVPTGSPLLRTTARLGLQWKKGINLMKAQVGLGAKAFFDPAVLDQSVIVAQGSLEDHLRLARKADLMLDADYYDAFQNLATSPCSGCFRRRDFRTGTAGGRLTAFDGPGAFWIGLAYRGFQYKPDPLLRLPVAGRRRRRELHLAGRPRRRLPRIEPRRHLSSGAPQLRGTGATPIGRARVRAG